MSITFEGLCSQIRAAYVDLGHNQYPDLKWSFLYTPKSTFSPLQDFMFVGLNPGGGLGEDAYEESLSCEGGNAYLVDQWSVFEAGKSPLQVQIQTFFKELVSCREQPSMDWKTFMDQSLALNFCPFRSPSWRDLGNKKNTLNFCRSLWTDILGYIQPKSILTIDRVSHRNLISIMNIQNFHEIYSETQTIGWSNVTYSLGVYSNGARKITLARFPHLSTYKIFSRTECQGTRTGVISKLAESLHS